MAALSDANERCREEKDREGGPEGEERLGRVRVAAATIILSSHTHIHQLGLLVLGRPLISISARIFFYPSHHSSSMENQSVFTLKDLGRKKCYKHYNESHEIDDNRETTAMDFLYFVNKVLFST